MEKEAVGRVLWPALLPFRVRSFRFQWPADLATSCAFEMETIVLGWYVLVETGSVALLTLLAALQFLGTLVAPVFGLTGDRIGHRNLLLAMRGFYLLLAIMLAVLSLMGALSPPLVLAVAALAGLVRPSDQGMRNVVISETIPPERLVSAVSLSRITSDAARGVGALTGAGIVAALGVGGAYLVIVGFYAVGCLLSLGIAGSGGVRGAGIAVAAPRASILRDLREAARAVWDTPPQLAAMSLALLVNLTAFPFTLGLLPYVARDVLGTDQAGLGLLVASVAAGCVAASLLLGHLGPAALPARLMVASGLAWHALILVFAQVGTLPGGMAVLVLLGVAQGLCVVPMSVLQLRTAEPAMRGRIMGLRTLAVYGLPVGLLAAGPLIGQLGFAAVGTAYGSAGLLGVALILLRWRAHLWPAGAPANRR